MAFFTRRGAVEFLVKILFRLFSSFRFQIFSLGFKHALTRDPPGGTCGIS